MIEQSLKKELLLIKEKKMKMMKQHKIMNILVNKQKME